MAFLRLEKVKWSHFFAKKAFQIQIVSEKAKNRTKNGQKITKRGVFIGTSALILQTVRTICRIP